MKNGKFEEEAMKELVERRQNKRFKDCDGLYAVFRPLAKIQGQDIDILGPVLNIGERGMLIEYVAAADRANQSYELDLIISRTSFYLTRLPFKTVWDTEIKNVLHSGFYMRRRGIVFGKVWSKKVFRLNYLIRKCAERPRRVEAIRLHERSGNEPTMNSYVL